mmetsp:Transcript_23913/g.53976  ORF Transcript_23913/g.53976 Transcript_23913/m.53976 type:complete len:246 (-) Transcript_23913:118-855(-)
MGNVQLDFCTGIHGVCTSDEELQEEDGESGAAVDESLTAAESVHSDGVSPIENSTLQPNVPTKNQSRASAAGAYNAKLDSIVISRPRFETSKDDPVPLRPKASRASSKTLASGSESGGPRLAGEQTKPKVLRPPARPARPAGGPRDNPARRSMVEQNSKTAQSEWESTSMINGSKPAAPQDLTEEMKAEIVGELENELQSELNKVKVELEEELNALKADKGFQGPLGSPKKKKKTRRKREPQKTY